MDEVRSAEIEAALMRHPTVANAAVVPIRVSNNARALYAFIKLKEGADGGQEMRRPLAKYLREQDGGQEIRRSLAEYLREQVGSLGVPETMYIEPDLPRHRVGTFKRDILAEIGARELD